MFSSSSFHAEGLWENCAALTNVMVKTAWVLGPDGLVILALLHASNAPGCDDVEARPCAQTQHPYIS